MSTHSNHLSRPLRDRGQSRALPEETPRADLSALPELLTRYLKERQQALYRQLLRDDPQTAVSLGSQDNQQEVLARLKEVDALPLRQVPR